MVNFLRVLALSPIFFFISTASFAQNNPDDLFSRPWLGVHMSPFDFNHPKYAELSSQFQIYSGVDVLKVADDSAAQDAGIKFGDIILYINSTYYQIYLFFL